MSVTSLRVAVPNEHGYALSFARRDTGKMCCCADHAVDLCSPCKHAFVEGQAATLRGTRPDIPSVVADAHVEQRDLAAFEPPKSYDLALLAKRGIEPRQAFEYTTEGFEPPRPYDVALTRRLAARGKAGAR